MLTTSILLPSRLTEQAIGLRDEHQDDRAFLATLYASTRWDELAPTGWTDEVKLAFLDQQFGFQFHHYATFYADATRTIILSGSDPIGRLYLHHGPTDLRIVDISLLPLFRGQGIGTALLEAVLAEASAHGVTASIHVEAFNPARRLYERLGFTQIENKGVYVLMQWRRSPTSAQE